MKQVAADTRDRYVVKAVVHSAKVLAAFRKLGEALPLREIVARSGLPKAMVFRLLYTLARCGMVEKAGENLYRSQFCHVRQKPYRLGHAAQGVDYPFSREISIGLQRAAAHMGLEIICVDNRYSQKVAQRNADVLVREKVDLVIEFQTDEELAPIVAAKYHEANIPFIAVDVPHPGATYFGANNYEAGLIAGRHLGGWAKRHWPTGIDEIVLIQPERAGGALRLRGAGMMAGATKVFPQVKRCIVTHLDSDGTLGNSFEVMRGHLRSSRSRRMLVGAINDPSALGALRACQEAGRAECCAIMGQNASPEGRAELRAQGTRLIGSVAHFPEHYGDQIVSVALDILHGRPVPPAVFVKHQLVTPANINHVYPNDELLAIASP